MTLVLVPKVETLAQEPIVQLTHSGARNGQPFYSPSGDWISFVSNRSGSWQIWLLPGAGGTARQITRSRGPVGWPTWTHDGDSILFYWRTDGGHRLSRIAITGGEPVPLRDDGLEDFRPMLSPDGLSLLFDRVGASAPNNHDLFVRDLQAHGLLRQLTSDPGYDSDGRWSPDGTRIVFHSDRDGPDHYATQVYVMNADGSSLRRLTDGPAVHAYPAWAPDGRHIVYTAELEGNRDIWIMSADGSFKRQVTRHPGFDGDPTWSPDGRHILFSTDRFGGQELALIDVSDLIQRRRPERDRGSWPRSAAADQPGNSASAHKEHWLKPWPRRQNKVRPRSRQTKDKRNHHGLMCSGRHAHGLIRSRSRQPSHS